MILRLFWRPKTNNLLFQDINKHEGNWAIILFTVLIGMVYNNDAAIYVSKSENNLNEEVYNR